MTGHDVLFWVFAMATCGGAIAVALSQNVVRMAFWLIVSLGSTSGLFFLLHADFVATAQLLVYVGGTLVLLIFGVMLTASGPFTTMKTSPGEGLIAAVIASALLALLVLTAGSMDWRTAVQRTSAPSQFHAQEVSRGGHNPVEMGSTARPLGLALLGARPDRDLGTDRAALSVGYLLPFEIASVHLLVVLIGAAYLARAKRRVKPPSTVNRL